MTKLDWSKGYEDDPARVQRQTECKTSFGWHKACQLALQRAQKLRAAAAPREEIKPKKAIKKKSVSAQKRREVRKLARAANKIVTKTARPQKSAPAKAALMARRAAFEEYRKTPEYFDKVQRQKGKNLQKQAEIAAKKKTHLEAWAERQEGLREDRRALKEKWRRTLLSA